MMNMKKSIYILFAIALTFCACENENNSIDRKVSFSATDISRVTDNSLWESNDKIGIFAGTSTSDITYNNYQYNITNVGTGEMIEDGDPIYLTSNYYAYYPYSATLGNNTTINIDASNQATIKPFLWAKAEGQTTDDINFLFNHQLVKVNINLIAGGTELIDLTTITEVKLKNVYTTVDFNLIDGGLSNQVTGEINLNHTLDPLDNTQATTTALLIPMSALGGNVKISISDGTDTYEKAITTSAWNKGETHNYSITVGN